MAEELADLQIRLAFQEQAIDELNTVVTRQQRLLERAESDMGQLRERLRALEATFEEGGEAGDERPPHY